MHSILRGRSLADDTATQPSRAGDDAFPATAAPEQALEACPTPCTPRPRDLEAYQAACRAAQGADVTVHTAVEIVPDMTCWHIDRWLTATHVVRDGQRVEMYFDNGDGTAARHASPTTEVYVLTGAPATHAEQT